MITSFFGPHRFLSNFWLCSPGKIYLHYGFCGADPNWYRSVEHAYQASKFPPEERHLIRATGDSASTAKHLGRGKGSAEWKRVNKDIMLHLLQQKFKEPYLRTLLLRTGDEELVEGNTWHDNYWGRCICPNCASTESHNHLGQLLTLVRWQLHHPELYL